MHDSHAPTSETRLLVPPAAWAPNLQPPPVHPLIHAAMTLLTVLIQQGLFDGQFPCESVLPPEYATFLLPHKVQPIPICHSHHVVPEAHHNGSLNGWSTLRDPTPFAKYPPETAYRLS